MQRVKITLPAVLTHIGPAVSGLGLAFGLRMTVEISERSDDQWIVETIGEGAGRYGLGLRHPVTQGMIRVFQQVETAPTGVHIRVNNPIPYGADLGVETIFMCAGVVGANNLVGNPLKRADAIALAAKASGRVDQAATTILGGLNACITLDDIPHYRTLASMPLKAVLALPQLGDDAKDPPAPSRTTRIGLEDALHNLARVPLVMEALRGGDLPLLARLFDDHLPQPKLSRGFDRAVQAAKDLGAAVTQTGSAVLAFSNEDHHVLADAIQAAFNAVGVIARWWSLTVDTQGVVVSAVSSG
jgi:homoserine kinase